MTSSVHTDAASTSIDRLSRFGLKLFLEDQVRLDPAACIPLFHQWIRTGALDRLLIDVADYSHLNDGPRVVLVGHEGNLAIDDLNGEMGLYATHKRSDAQTLDRRVRAVVRLLLTAAQLLENDASFTGQIRFRTDLLLFVANDRLVAPPGAATMTRVSAALTPCLDQLFGMGTYQFEAPPADRDRFMARTTAQDPAPLRVLVQRLQ